MKLSSATVEGIKEFFRTLILGMIIPIGSTIGIIKAGVNVDLGTFGIQWNLALAILVSGFLGSLQVALPKALDKWLHKNSVSTPLDLTRLDSLKE